MMEYTLIDFVRAFYKVMKADLRNYKLKLEKEPNREDYRAKVELLENQINIFEHNIKGL